MAPRIWLTAPFGEYIQVQATAAAAPGMICGRNIRVRATPPKNFDLTSRTMEATISATITGSTVKKMIRMNACAMEDNNAGSVKTVL